MSQVPVKPLVIHIRADLKDKLKAIAIKRDLPMTKLIEEMIVHLASQDTEDIEQKKKKGGKKGNQS